MFPKNREQNTNTNPMVIYVYFSTWKLQVMCVNHLGEYDAFNIAETACPS